MVQVSLDPSLEEFVQEKVRAGQFADATELVNDAVRLMRELEQEESEEIERLRAELRIGIDQLDRGEGTPWDPEEIKAEGRRRLQQRQQGG
jgi:antitoxin ParD1/3/4